jgi:nicotinamidase-related amidase
LTNVCCGTTARQGYERGFNVVVVGDLTATDDRELHEAELKTLRKGFARVLSLEELLAELPQSVSPADKRRRRDSSPPPSRRR